MADPYKSAVTADSPIAWWHLDETTGTTAADAAGTNAGTYTGSPTLGAVGLAFSDTTNLCPSFSNLSLQYVQVPHAATLNAASLTVEALIDPTSINGNNRIIEKGLSDSGWALKFEGSNLRWYVAGRVTVDYAFTDTGRHHVAGTYNSATGVGILYVDGAQVATVTGTAGSAPTPSDPLRIGQKPGGSVLADGANGKIDEPAVYSSVLSPTRIAAHAAAAGLTGTPTQFTWKGYTWDRAQRPAGSPFVNSFAADHAPIDSDGYLHLQVTNNGDGTSVGAEVSSTTQGLGYGTYVCVVASPVYNLHPNIVFGGMFTYGASSAYGHREIDANEQSMFSGATGPCQLSHTHWQSSVVGDPTGPRGGFNAAAGVTAPSVSSHTAVLIWERAKITYRFYSGLVVDPANLLREDVVVAGQTVTFNIESGGSYTGPAFIPVPGDERVHFNLWVCPDFGGGSDPATVTSADIIVRDFSFVPLPASSGRFVAVTIGTGTNPEVPPPDPTPTPTTRFYSDPGAESYYVGVSPSVSTIATHESKMGAPLAMIRSFASGDTPPWSDVDSIIAGQRIPWMAWRFGSKSITDIANGVYDAWIDGIAAQIDARAPWPIWWTWTHEPENDSATGGTPFNATLLNSYRRAQRRIRQRITAAGVTNDVFACVCYMTPFTWNEAASGRDWRQFYPDWKNTTGAGSAANPDPNDFYIDGDPNSVVDVIGLDFYHNWEIADGLSRWTGTTPQSGWNRYGSRSSFLGKPYAIGEWSTMAAQDNVNIDPNGDGHFTVTEYNAQVATINYRPDLTNTWIDDYFGNRVNGTVAFCWWDQSLQAAGDVAVNPLSIADPAETRWDRLGVWGSNAAAKKWTTAGVVNAV